MTWQMLCCGWMFPGCGERWYLGSHCWLSSVKGKASCPCPSKAGRMQGKLVKCSSTTGRQTSSCIQPTWDQRGPYCSWSCSSQWRSRWSPSQTKVTPLRLSLHGVIRHDWSTSLFPWPQKSPLGQWCFSDSVSICPRIAAVAVGSSMFWTCCCENIVSPLKIYLAM